MIYVYLSFQDFVVVGKSSIQFSSMQHVSKCTCAKVFLGYIPKNKIAGPEGIFFQSNCTNFPPTSNGWELCCSKLAKTWYFPTLKNFGKLKSKKWYFLVVLICMSSISNQVTYLSFCLLLYCIIIFSTDNRFYLNILDSSPLLVMCL